MTNEKDIIYQVNYKKGSFTYETQKIVINITKDMATLDPSKDSSSMTLGLINLSTWAIDKTSPI